MLTFFVTIGHRHADRTWRDRAYIREEKRKDAKTIFGGIYFTLATSMMAWAMYLHRDIKWSVPAYALVGVALFFKQFFS